MSLYYCKVTAQAQVRKSGQNNLWKNNAPPTRCFLERSEKFCEMSVKVHHEPNNAIEHDIHKRNVLSLAMFTCMLCSLG